MPDLLLELRSEEIPARMQRKAAGDLRKMVTDGLVEAGLTYEAAREYFTPRRLTLDLRGITARSKDVREEIKGPSTKAPPQAVEGFLRKAGLSDISQAHVHSDPKKGDLYVAHISKPGRAAEKIIAELVPAVIRAFPWPKSMRWGPASAKPGSLRWVRPLQSIVCTFGPETAEPVVVDFEVDGIRSGNVTYGHRFHAPGAITVRRFDDYAGKLEAAKVVIDADRRKEIILSDAKNLAFANGLDLVEDDGLLEEVAGLVEWPVVLMGQFEEDFLAIPPEVIRLTIRANQKCFVTRPSASISPTRGEISQAQLSNRFILTANIEARDGGAEIVHGNGKVVRARLSDALYFWKTDQGDLPDLDQLKPSAEKFGLDLSKPLDQRMARLDHLGVTFHAKLGTQGERVERIARLAEELAPIVARSLPLEGRVGAAGAGVGSQKPNSTSSENEVAAVEVAQPGHPSAGLPPHQGEGDLPAFARRAAILAKADLTTEMVGEFPELQGAMGRKYALLQGEHPSVAAAIEEHYKPQGPSDSVPTDPVSIAVALADKLDMLVGFWAIDEKPTGSKDPYALRRAALGVIRILGENAIDLPLQSVIADHHARVTAHDYASSADATVSLLTFLEDRLSVSLRDKGIASDKLDAVLTLSGLVQGHPFMRVLRRVLALADLLSTDEGKDLLAGTKRAANILAAEEKKGTAISPTVDPALLSHPAEKGLFDAVNQAESNAAQAIQNEDFSAAMLALSALREPVDSFFEQVLVNDEDAAVRANRLGLLARIRSATGQVADFSKIAG